MPPPSKKALRTFSKPSSCAMQRLLTNNHQRCDTKKGETYIILDFGGESERYGMRYGPFARGRRTAVTYVDWGKPRVSGASSKLSVACFDLFELTAERGLKFVELFRTQSGNAPFDITFHVWIYGTKLEASDTSRHVELQGGKGDACATAGHCRLELADRDRPIHYCID